MSLSFYKKVCSPKWNYTPKNAAPFVATQILCPPYRERRAENAFLPKNKNTFSVKWAYRIYVAWLWYHKQMSNASVLQSFCCGVPLLTVWWSVYSRSPAIIQKRTGKKAELKLHTKKARTANTAALVVYFSFFFPLGPLGLDSGRIFQSFTK